MTAKTLHHRAGEEPPDPAWGVEGAPGDLRRCAECGDPLEGIGNYCSPCLETIHDDLSRRLSRRMNLRR